MAARSYEALSPRDMQMVSRESQNSDAMSGSTEDTKPASTVLGKLCQGLCGFFANFFNYPKLVEFAAPANHKCAKCIWFLLFLFFLFAVSVQIRSWLDLGYDPPVVMSEDKNEFYFAPNMQFCNDVADARPIDVESIQVYEEKAELLVPLVSGVDFFIVTDCKIATEKCDKEPPTGCPIPEDLWPRDPKSGLRVKAGHELHPLGGCVQAEKTCTRVFVNPVESTKLEKSDKKGVITELQVTVRRRVDPRQWLFESGIVPNRCLYSPDGIQMKLGGDCNKYVQDDDLRSMFQFYAKDGESGMIKERGGDCLQADIPKYHHAVLAPCEVTSSLAGGVRFHSKSGRIVQEGGPKDMCLTQGSGHPLETIKIPWGNTDISAFKVYWQLCGDQDNDPDLYKVQRWDFDSETGFVTASIQLPKQRPQPFCLLMSDFEDHMSENTKLIVLLPCSLIAPTATEADDWWKQAPESDSAWIAVKKAEDHHLRAKGALKTIEDTKECKIETEVMPGKNFSGSSRLVCVHNTTSCFSKCGFCDPQCRYLEWLGDGHCNVGCNNAACNFDCNAEACDCKAAGETTKPSEEQVANFRDTVLGTFNDCKKTCKTHTSSRTNYLRFKWETYEENAIGSLIRLSDNFPNKGCGGDGTGCYNQVYKAFKPLADLPTGPGKWCLSAYSGDDSLPLTPAEVSGVTIASPVSPKDVTLTSCHPQRNTQRFFYESHTGFIRSKAGRCMTLNSPLTCRTITTPTEAVETIQVEGSFDNLQKCGEAVLNKRATNFTFRGVSGVTYTTSSKSCAANLGHVPTDVSQPGKEMCHFDVLEAEPSVAFTSCDESDPAQVWQVTPQTIFAPKVAFLPPQTQAPIWGFAHFVRVLYEMSGLKGVIDELLIAINPKDGYEGLWLQEMPLELSVPGEKDWDAAASTETSRNQQYRMALDSVGYGEKNFWTIEMPWSLSSERMRNMVRRSDLVITKDPSESLRVERVYLNVGYHSEKVVHYIKTADLLTEFTTMLAVITATAGLLKCWTLVFPFHNTQHLTISGSAWTHLKEELEAHDITTDDVYEHTGIDIPYHIENSRGPCCPCFFDHDHEE